jgi:ceramide synthetase
MIELAFYWSLVFSQFIDVKRKDFWQMFIHHIATILLLSFSYIVNFVRVGTLVLVVHDCGDYWLEVKIKKFFLIVSILFFFSVQKWRNMHEHSDSVICCS